jgi:hypothetical protein
MPVPVIILSDLKFINVKALAAPAAVNAVLTAPWLVGHDVKLPAMSSTGLSRPERDEVRNYQLACMYICYVGMCVCAAAYPADGLVGTVESRTGAH